jgi:hypothetical protein
MLNKDILLVCNDNRELMLNLRSAILQTFPGAWLLVHRDGSGTQWGIELLSDWGTTASSSKRAPFEEFVENYMLNYHCKEKQQ